MDESVKEWLNVGFRWIHLVAGIAWIGHLYFFNWVNAQVAKTYDADSKKKVVPELMPRALYFFRWGALWTWVTGILLFGIVYSMGGVMFDPDSPLVERFGTGAPGIGTLIIVVIFIVGFFIYDALWKSGLGKNEKVAAGVTFVLFLASIAGLHFANWFSGRTLFIIAGGLFGTAMMMNVWMRIWPAQRKIIGGIKGSSPAPDASVAAMAGLRSKHNTYMSVPLMFFMISNHASTLLAHDHNWAIIGLIVLVGWAATKWLYTTSASPKTAKF